jgi:hypothetical protein
LKKLSARRTRKDNPLKGAAEIKGACLLERFADPWPLFVQLGDVPCKVLHSAGDVALAHAVGAVYVVAALAALRNSLVAQKLLNGLTILNFYLCKHF